LFGSPYTLLYFFLKVGLVKMKINCEIHSNLVRMIFINFNNNFEIIFAEINLDYFDFNLFMKLAKGET
jgi:hypothetical protein